MDCFTFKVKLTCRRETIVYKVPNKFLSSYNYWLGISTFKHYVRAEDLDNFLKVILAREIITRGIQQHGNDYQRLVDELSEIRPYYTLTSDGFRLPYYPIGYTFN